ncbi:class I SAM-dependent methyltransferase [Bacillus sp. JJ722]|uniref:class I SAM-dependent methyltransferase n=1 Tax=Bacillus sp. JJ722 TaxID=3122973 RepID=UPI002FFEEE14
MPFYKTLTPYYDDIFPTNERTLSFLTSHFKEGGTILDIGAGTGNMAISLSHQDFHVTAAEPEVDMAKQILLKAESCQYPITVTTNTMQQIGELEGSYDGIYCIGNTLVHLNKLEEFHTFLEQAFQKLHPEGVLIIQIVNFDKVLLKNDFTFPIIKNKMFTFERQYALDGKHILFTTTLSVNKESQTNTIRLYPITSTQLLSILKHSGFEIIDAYGNFEYKDYSIDSPALVVVAKKRK